MPAIGGRLAVVRFDFRETVAWMPQLRAGDNVLENGCTHLQRRLSGARLSPGLTAKAWLALALAGRVSRDELAGYLRDIDQRTAPESEDRLRLVLAGRLAGLYEASERLWGELKSSAPTSTEGIALKSIEDLVNREQLASVADCEDYDSFRPAERQGDQADGRRSFVTVSLLL